MLKLLLLPISQLFGKVFKFRIPSAQYFSLQVLPVESCMCVCSHLGKYRHVYNTYHLHTLLQCNVDTSPLRGVSCVPPLKPGWASVANLANIM